MKLNYDIVYGTFIKRPNRFIAHIKSGEEELICHVPNTGRLKELLYPGVDVLLSYHPSPHRKTKYELRMIRRNGVWVSIDSQLPNALAVEAITNGTTSELQGYSFLSREYTYGNSRFDIFLQFPSTPCFVEVKGVTLEKDGWGYFPDAPTERGRKHINELIKAKNDGYRSVLFFLVQHPHIQGFPPNDATDPLFGEKVREARKSGVEIICYGCNVSEDEIIVVSSLPIKL